MQLLLKCARLLNDKGAILSEQAEKYPHLFEIERKNQEVVCCCQRTHKWCAIGVRST